MVAALFLLLSLTFIGAPLTALLIWTVKIYLATGAPLRACLLQSLFLAGYHLHLAVPAVGRFLHRHALAKHPGPHSEVVVVKAGPVAVCAVPFLGDNYAYIVAGKAGHAIVDPGDAAAVTARTPPGSGAPLALLITHRHHDHCGGAAELCGTHGIPAYGPRADRPDGMDRAVEDNDELQIPGLPGIRVLSVPCHTRGHVLFQLGDHAVFTGDAVFSGGVGKFFEGDARDLEGVLKIFSSLPDETLVFPGHEYTHANLRFANYVLPDNTTISKRLSWAAAQRDASLPTVPSTVAIEKTTNLFVMALTDKSLRETAIRMAKELPKSPSVILDPRWDHVAQALAALRILRNHFA